MQPRNRRFLKVFLKVSFRGNSRDKNIVETGSPSTFIDRVRISGRLMKYSSVLFILTIHYSAYSQNGFLLVNRAAVEKMVSDSMASTYYPKLLERFKADDTTLSGEEFRLLYYGFVFQKEYSGYPDLNQKEINEAMGKKKYDDAVKFCDEVLSQYPINLFANYNKGLALFLKNKEDSGFIKYRNRYGRIMNAIISSGDGLTCNTAFKTIFVNDEYFVMYRYFEVKSFKGQALETPCDRMSVSPSEYFKADKMYFDTSETLLYMERLLEKK